MVGTAGKTTQGARAEGGGDAGRDAPTPGKQTLIDAARGGRAPLAGAGRELPHRAKIEASFGVPITATAHVGDEAAEACDALDANAFASGEQVAFGDGEPDLWTAAHEAAHTVQQRRGVQLGGVVGEDGDAYERIACEAADRVVAGQSAHDLFIASGDAAAAPAPGGHIQRDRTGRRDESEREGDRDRRDRRSAGGRGRNRRGLGDDLDSDWAGRAILERYLDGGGDWNLEDNAAWSAYMKASDRLRDQLVDQVTTLARKYQREARGDLAHAPFLKTFHAEVENGEGIIGYQYLHGTNKDVGDFVIMGTLDTHQQNGQSRVIPQLAPADPNMCEAPPNMSRQDTEEVPPRFTIDLNAFFQWNDRIDPNGNYTTDKIKDAIAWIISGGARTAYNISIGWHERVHIVLDEAGNLVETTGYPFQ